MVKKLDRSKETELLKKEIINAIQEKKGHDITIIDLKELDKAVCDYFIVCHGTSNTQVEAITGSVEQLVKKNIKQSPTSIEGLENSEWIVIDYFDVIVHIFLEEKRYFYQLENLWGDAKITNIENKY